MWQTDGRTDWQTVQTYSSLRFHRWMTKKSPILLWLQINKFVLSTSIWLYLADTNFRDMRWMFRLKLTSFALEPEQLAHNQHVPPGHYKNQQTRQIKGMICLEQISWCLTHSFDTDFYIPADTLQKFTWKQQCDATKAWLHKIADRFRMVSLECQDFLPTNWCRYW